MKTIMQVILVLVGVLLMSGCGDQVWCGENGCGASREANSFTLLPKHDADK